MKDLIQRILNGIHPGLEINSEYLIVGSCMEFELTFSPSADLPAKWQTTVQHIEIIATLQRMGAIRGHDAATKQVFTHKGHAKHLWEALATVGEPTLQMELLNHHLTCALNILDYDGDPEDLIYLFNDFSIIEKCAWLHRMAELPSIKLHSARNMVHNLLNYHDGTIASFPSVVPIEVQIFAKWLQRNPHNIFTLCHPIQAPQSGYVTTATL